MLNLMTSTAVLSAEILESFTVCGNLIEAVFAGSEVSSRASER